MIQYEKKYEKGMIDMKYIKWKTLIITSIVCLLPIFLGLALWDKLPEMVAVHFDINNNPDNFAPKWFAVFGLPVTMTLLQIFCCFTNDIKANKYGENKKFEIATKWIIPVISVVLYTVTMFYALGRNIDIRRVAMLLISVIFIVLGCCMTKLNYVKNYDISPEKARKINRVIGIMMVIMGILGFLTLFLTPVFLIIWLLLLVLVAIIGIIYGIVVGRK